MKLTILSLCLATCTGLASAAPATWTFTYTGFFGNGGVLAPAGVFVPDASFSGSFTGEDLDHDGVLALSELSNFDLDGRTFVPGFSDPGGLAGASLSRFSFGLRTGQLDFGAFSFWRDGEGIAGSEFTFDTGVRATLIEFPLGIIYDYSWDPRTRLAVNPPPVPEPASWMLWAVGLAGLIGSKTRRRRACLH